jgi:hypothetical protein
MAFLDNSGDIILDVVLTDHGRKIMAKGDGSFQITKFAVCDEEINYTLYNSNHGSGSAYYDLEILQTPVLEAFTNNASSMKTKLASFQDLNLLYLPVLKINENLSNTARHSVGSFVVAVDRETEGTDSAQTSFAIGVDSSGTHVKGILFGASFESSQTIRVDQGIDSNEISPKQVSLMTNLIEDVYMVQIDNRLGSLVDTQGDLIGEDYIDDDNIAYYTVDSFAGVVSVNNDDSNSATQTIQGPRGTILEFKIASSMELNTSTFLFTQLGGTVNMDKKGGGQTPVRFIDSIVKVTGMKTGYSVDIPVRFIKTIIT